MNCKTIDEFLYSRSLDELDLPHDGLMLHHIKRCENCQDSYNSVRHYLKTLERTSTSTLAPERVEFFLRTARTTHQQLTAGERSSPSSWLGQGLAIACGILLVFTLGFFSQASLQPSSSADIKETVFAQQVLNASNISLMIEVPADMLQANLALEFPDQLRWRGLEEMQRIEWPVNLEKGVNVLELPVTLTSQLENKKPLIISGSLKYQKSTKHFQLPVNITTQRPHPQQTKTLI